jgi:hypothetical protein
MANPVLSYLPPGWTEEQLKNATHQDLSSLTGEQLQKVIDRHAAALKRLNEMDAKRFTRPAKPVQGGHGERSQPSQQAIDPATKNLTNPLTYLPPGWTEDKLKNATDEEYQTLTSEQAQKVLDRSVARHAQMLKLFDQNNAKRIARGAEPIPYPHDHCNDAAGGKGKQPQSSQQIVDPATENLTHLLDHVEQSGLDIFGFVLFRTYYSCDDESWEAFQDGFYDIMDEGIAAASPDFDRIEDKVFIRIVSDDSLKNQSPEVVIMAYLVCMEEEEEATDGDDEEAWGDEIEPGLTTSMCIMVDEECIRSVLDKSATPFVKAVDVATGAGQVIKVAIASLVPAFYAALLVYSSADVASKVSDDGIWRSIGPWGQEMEGRRVLKLTER